MYVLAFKRDGVVIGDQTLLDITGDSDYIFKFDKEFENFPKSWIDDMIKHFCEDPCVHVLHDE